MCLVSYIYELQSIPSTWWHQQQICPCMCLAYMQNFIHSKFVTQSFFSSSRSAYSMKLIHAQLSRLKIRLCHKYSAMIIWIENVRGKNTPEFKVLHWAYTQQMWKFFSFLAYFVRKGVKHSTNVRYESNVYKFWIDMCTANCRVSIFQAGFFFLQNDSGKVCRVRKKKHRIALDERKKNKSNVVQWKPNE